MDTRGSSLLVFFVEGKVLTDSAMVAVFMQSK